MPTSFRAVNISGTGDPPPPNGSGYPIGSRYLVEDALPGEIREWALFNVSGTPTVTYAWRACGCDDAYYYYTEEVG